VKREHCGVFGYRTKQGGKKLMDPILKLLLGALVACLALLLLSAITRAARRRSRQISQREEPVHTEPQAAAIQPFTFTSASVAQEHTAEWWWSQLLSGKAVLGALFIPLQLIVLVINSYVLALRLEVLLNRVGDPLFTLGTLGWDREITVFDIVGCLISLIQVVAAAAFAHALSRKERFTWPSIAALGAWLMMMTVEVMLSFLSGLSAGGALWAAVLNGLLAGGLALTDSLFGIYIFEHLAIPLALAIAWSIATPIRALVKVARARASFWAISRREPSRSESGKSNLLYSTVGAIDPVFQPLRDLDAFTYRFLRSLQANKLKPAKERKEKSHVQTQTDEALPGPADLRGDAGKL
jgi:hypothetical protein